MKYRNEHKFNRTKNVKVNGNDRGDGTVEL